MKVTSKARGPNAVNEKKTPVGRNAVNEKKTPVKGRRSQDVEPEEEEKLTIKKVGKSPAPKKVVEKEETTSEEATSEEESEEEINNEVSFVKTQNSTLTKSDEEEDDSDEEEDDDDDEEDEEEEDDDGEEQVKKEEDGENAKVPEAPATWELSRVDTYYVKKGERLISFWFHGFDLQPEDAEIIKEFSGKLSDITPVHPMRNMPPGKTFPGPHRPNFRPGMPPRPGHPGNKAPFRPPHPGMKNQFGPKPFRFGQNPNQFGPNRPPNQFGPNRSPKMVGECVICKNPGHMPRQCHFNRYSLYPQGSSCRHCKEVVHYEDQCPNVGKAPQKRPFPHQPTGPARPWKAPRVSS